MVQPLMRNRTFDTHMNEMSTVKLGEATDEEHLVEVIRRDDTNECGLRLVCELAAIRHRPLYRDEWEILKFIR